MSAPQPKISAPPRFPRSLPLLPLRLCLWGAGGALLGGCLPDEQGLLSALTDTWGAQTVSAAEPPVNAALLVSGLSAELCRSDPDWSTLQVGDPAPLSELLYAALGAPTIDALPIEDGSQQIIFGGVRVMDREAANLRFTATRGASAYEINADVVDGRGATPFGSLRLSIALPCDEGAVWVSGEARWTDLNGITHTISLPAEEALSSGLSFNCAYLPRAGTLAWQGRVDGQLRSFTTTDAAELRLQSGDALADSGMDSPGTVTCQELGDVSGARWPGTARGSSGEWATTVNLNIPIADAAR